MALKATIYKADLNIADMDQHQYGDYQLTLALHPSETLERLMVRIVAFARYADEQLEFTKDLFETDEPALWKTLENVEVWQISAESSAQLEQLSQRTMQLQLNVMDGEWTLIGDQAQVVIQWTQLQGL